ncbi:ORF46 [Leucania separata nucleopolyhedrovirus]|uniref:ORF46 n=1 Tax=Leucania separata nucleopolyhedrovirus TaxID=1307956 RepID=Q0IL73_NPVLS|nr:ORF46 [Leucania separata nucleopolyhedrovirus]AAR28810.1 ORF46 [Leucania separata nucleopolyhedrovirus]
MGCCCCCCSIASFSCSKLKVFQNWCIDKKFELIYTFLLSRAHMHYVIEEYELIVCANEERLLLARAVAEVSRINWCNVSYSSPL